MLHEDFIPQEYLPTFNSTCIEMFLHQIPNLSEYFLYANDDIFVIQPLIETHFFKRGKVKTHTFKGGDFNLLYGHHKINGYCLVFNQNKEHVLASGKVPSLSHVIRPYIKSQMQECFTKYQAAILASISRFREIKNLNVYLFDYYAIKNRMSYPKEGINNLHISSLSDAATWALIFNDNAQYLEQRHINMLCIQDNSNDMNIYEDTHLINYFSTHYPTKSKYEK